jgi:hypothetical protein
VIAYRSHKPKAIDEILTHFAKETKSTSKGGTRKIRATADGSAMSILSKKSSARME